MAYWRTVWQVGTQVALPRSEHYLETSKWSLNFLRRIE